VSGTSYVADSDNNRIQKFDNTGTFLTALGHFRRRKRQFNYRSGVAVARAVTCTSDTRTTASGSSITTAPFLTAWTGASPGAAAHAYRAFSLGIDGSGNVFVATMATTI